MFEDPVEKTIVITAVVLWFAQGTYLNLQLQKVHKRFDSLVDHLNGLRRYLYEIDPQFDEERRVKEESEDENLTFQGHDYLKLLKKKRGEGRRTLDTPFTEI